MWKLFMPSQKVDVKLMSLQIYFYLSWFDFEHNMTSETCTNEIELALLNHLVYRLNVIMCAAAIYIIKVAKTCNAYIEFLQNLTHSQYIIISIVHGPRTPKIFWMNE